MDERVGQRNGRQGPGESGTRAGRQQTPRNAVRSRDNERGSEEPRRFGSSSSSEGDDMTWEDFLASTDDVTDASGMGPETTALSSGHRRSSPPLPSAPPHRSSNPSFGRGPPSRQSVGAGYRPTLVLRQQHGLPTGMRGGEVGGTRHGGVSSSWGPSQVPNSQKAAGVRGDDEGSDNESSAVGVSWVDCLTLPPRTGCDIPLPTPSECQMR